MKERVFHVRKGDSTRCGKGGKHVVDEIGFQTISITRLCKACSGQVMCKPPDPKCKRALRKARRIAIEFKDASR